MHTNGLCAARGALITIPSTAPLVRNGAGSAVDASPGGKRRQVEGAGASGEEVEKGGGGGERGGGGGGGHRMAAAKPFSQSGLTRR